MVLVTEGGSEYLLDGVSGRLNASAPVRAAPNSIACRPPFIFFSVEKYQSILVTSVPDVTCISKTIQIYLDRVLRSVLARHIRTRFPTELSWCPSVPEPRPPDSGALLCFVKPSSLSRGFLQPHEDEVSCQGLPFSCSRGDSPNTTSASKTRKRGLGGMEGKLSKSSLTIGNRRMRRGEIDFGKIRIAWIEPIEYQCCKCAMLSCHGN